MYIKLKPFCQEFWIMLAWNSNMSFFMIIGHFSFVLIVSMLKCFLYSHQEGAESPWNARMHTQVLSVRREQGENISRVTPITAHWARRRGRGRKIQAQIKSSLRGVSNAAINRRSVKSTLFWWNRWRSKKRNVARQGRDIDKSPARPVAKMSAGKFEFSPKAPRRNKS